MFYFTEFKIATILEKITEFMLQLPFHRIFCAMTTTAQNRKNRYFYKYKDLIMLQGLENSQYSEKLKENIIVLFYYVQFY